MSIDPARVSEITIPPHHLPSGSNSGPNAATGIITMGNRIWITGAQGFIGRHLAKWLAGRGYVVSGIGHGLWPASEAAAWGVQHWLSGDIHSSNLRHLLRDCGAPDCVFHLAGGSSVGAAIASP